MVETSWINVFLPPKPNRLCQACEAELHTLHGQRCSHCSRITVDSVCSDCTWWKQFMNGNDVLDKNYSVFAYNDRMQEMITKWKYRGDYQIGYVFQTTFQDCFPKIIQTKQQIVVPIPLSPERLYERSFNQAEMLAQFLPIKSVNALSRIHGEKQSKKTRQERISSINPFKLEEPINKPVILVDDIYTTGATLRHAAALLKEHGCPMVYSYTLIRG